MQKSVYAWIRRSVCVLQGLAGRQASNASEKRVFDSEIETGGKRVSAMDGIQEAALAR